MLVLRLGAERPNAEMIGLRLRELSLPDGTLIAMIRRAGELVIPRGDTPLEDGDRLTVIGRPEGINALRHRYAPLTP
jgi:Trk K+ transport system NAD-binding subunit